MMIKLNLKGNYKTVKEGERALTITDAKFMPSGAPTKLVLYMKDTEDGATLQNTYNLENNTSQWAMGVMLSTALGLEDGDEFDTKDVAKLINTTLLCEVSHSEYNGRKYANVKKVISKVETETTNILDVVDEMNGRNAISSDDDLD